MAIRVMTQKNQYETSYAGCVLMTGEHNYYDDSDFYALVWDEENKTIKEIEYATTRACTYNNSARPDATPETIAKAYQYRYQTALTDMISAAVEVAMTPDLGSLVQVTRGKHKEQKGIVFWRGRDKYKRTGDRIGIRLDNGEAVFVALDQAKVLDPENWMMSLENLKYRAQHVADNSRERWEQEIKRSA